MENRRNYYRILHVQVDAPPAMIKASYRTLMQKLKAHPDLGGEHWNASIINEAYRVLSNPQMRAEYDRNLLKRFSKKSLSGFTTRLATHNNTEKSGEQKIGECLFCGLAYARLNGHGQCVRCDVPLRITDPIITERDKRRATDRVHMDDMIYYTTFWDDPLQHADLIDISPNGIGLITHENFDNNQVLKIQSEHIVAAGRIVYCKCNNVDSDGKKYKVGVEFLTVSFRKERGNFFSDRA